MSSNFTIDDEDRSEQLPSVEEARMNVAASRRQSNASLSKASDVETAYSGSVEPGESEHDQLPSVDDIRINSPRGRGGRCKFFLLAAFVVLAAAILTVILVVTKADPEGDEFNMMQNGAFEDNNEPNPDGPPTTYVPTTQEDNTPVETTDAPQQPEETTATPLPSVDRVAAIRQIMADRGVTSIDILNEVGTPQQKAIGFLANIDQRQIPVDEADSLVQRYVVTVMYYAMGGDGWSNRLNFLSKEDECKWYIAGFAGDSKAPRQFGITCNDQGKVQAIHFPSNFLAGSFPMELSKLSNLERLEVFNNDKLTGGFPQFLNGMPRISFIGLHYCKLQGQLPSWLGSLTSLKSLVLSNNEFSGPLPSSMSKLVNIQDLYLDDNSFTGNIGMLKGLSKLKKLVLEDNAFEGTLDADVVSTWPLIEVFDASHNKFTSTIPSAILASSNLRILDMHANSFTGALPIPVGSLLSLELMTLHQNSLEGSIPDEFGQFAKLHTLSLATNKLYSDIPAALGDIATLKYLFLAQNDFNPGPIPETFANLKSLQQLSLKSTSRTGNIPSWIGNLSELILLDLDNNQLTGNIPDSLGNCFQMEYLLLNRNQLQGTVPTSLSGMPMLKYFMVDQNELSGSADAVCSFPQNVEMFVADCQGGTAAEIDCPCCNVCCSQANALCNDNLWLGDANPIWELGFDVGSVELDASATRSYTVQFAGDIP